MKPQTTKKHLAFIIIMMFSISYLHPQCAKGWILMHARFPRAGCGTVCVLPGNVNYMESIGFKLGPCSATATLNDLKRGKPLSKQKSNPSLAIIHVNNEIDPREMVHR